MTYLNHNVLFEFGYALGLRKPLWLSLNTAEPTAQDSYKRFTLLRGFGYSPYINRDQFVDHFYSESPWMSESPFPLSRMFDSPTTSRDRPSLLYLKSPLETDTSITLTSTIDSSRLFGQNVVVDDPAEVPQDQLAWFVSHLRSTEATVVHLLRSDHPRAQWHNAKCSLISGIATALGRPLLMLADHPFEAPFDYQNVLREVRTAAETKRVTTRWIESVETEVEGYWKTVWSQRTRTSQSKTLQNLRIGEPIAENEKDTLDGVFVETSAYYNLLRGTQTLFIGRKGTGKTANFYQAASTLAVDRRNLVCILKPVSHDIEAIIELLSGIMSRSERGYLVEAVWKLLLYTEIAMQIRDSIQIRPMHSLSSDDENLLLQFIESRSGLFDTSYARRLEVAVDLVYGLSHNRGDQDKLIRFSEDLHQAVLSDLSRFISPTIQSLERIIMFVDNLDKTWDSESNVELSADIVLGLLGVAGRIFDEFRVVRGDVYGPSLDLAVFLRSDIFRVVRSFARESDKLLFERIEWSDWELLVSVIDKRLAVSLNEDLPPDELWKKVSVSHVESVPVREYAAKAVLPRPRDIIYFVQSAINRAVDRGHVHIEVEDFRSAMEDYSEYALRSLYAEDDPRGGQIEAVLIEFAGQRANLTFSDVTSTVAEAGIEGGDIERYIDLLCDLNFLGILNQSGRFEYARDEERRNVLRKSSSGRIRRSHGRWRQNGPGDHAVEIFQINPVFHHALDIRQ